jgi:hypothetical protein
MMVVRDTTWAFQVEELSMSAGLPLWVSVETQSYCGIYTKNCD